MDTNNRGELTEKELRKYFVEQGEKFALEEMEELKNAAVDASTHTVLYKNFVHFLVVDEDAL